MRAELLIPLDVDGPLTLEEQVRRGIVRAVAAGDLIGCGHPVWAPYMSGYGGISIVMFPNGVRFYAFNDENHFDWAAAVPEVDKIRPLCR